MSTKKSGRASRSRAVAAWRRAARSGSDSAVHCASVSPISLPLATTATEIVESNAGKVTKTETWGLKNLAYKIQRNRKAHFVLLNIEAPAGTVAELERQTAINEDVIRWLTVRVDEHETGPSVQMRKQDRERSRRRDREEF